MQLCNFTQASRLQLLLLAIITVFISLIFTLPVYGQSGAGIGIRPALIDDRMEPGDRKDYQITVSNLSSEGRLFYIYKRDIVDATDAGAPIFGNQNREISGLELSQWISLATSSVFIEASGTAVLDVSVVAPVNITPGSHFAGIVVSAEPPELETSGAAVGYEVSNIISMRIAGDTKEEASIRQFATNRYFYSNLDVSFNVRIENSGTTLVRPTGPLVVKNMFGQEVASLVFNESQAGIFPGKTREFIVDWKGEQVGFGRYEAMITPVYGETGARKTLTSTVTFWVLPMNIIGPAAGILLGILLATYLLVRLYIRRQLALHTTSTRRISRRSNDTSSGFVVVTLAMLTVTALFLIVLLIMFS